MQSTITTARRRGARAPLITTTESDFSPAPGVNTPPSSHLDLYLIAYNAGCMAGWGYALFLGLTALATGGQLSATWATMGMSIVIAQWAMGMEMVHAATGMVRSPVMTVVMQVLSRLQFLVWIPLAPTSATHWGCGLMAISWALVEVPRYAFYLNNLVGPGGQAGTLYPIFWLRYSLFAILYPTGISGEILTLLACLNDPSFATALGGFAPLLVKGMLVIYVPAAPFMYMNMVGNRKGAFKKRFAPELEEPLLQPGPAMPKPSDPAAEIGVLFPADETGKRSTIAGGKAVFAAAAAAADPALSAKIAGEKNWRQKYEKHLVALVEAGSKSPASALAIAEAGLAAIHSTFEFVRDGATVSLADAMAKPKADAALSSAQVMGASPPLGKVVVPYEGAELEGDALLKQVRTWTEAGAMEPGCERALAGLVAAGAAPLDLSQHVFVILGATSALGPIKQLLAWGATVIGVARKKPQSWKGLIAMARASAGTFIFPVTGGPPSSTASDDDLAAVAGADLMVDTPELLAWLQGAVPATHKKVPVLGMYTYLDSDAHVRVSIACDLIMSALAPPRGQAALAYMQTPSLAYDIPEADVQASQRFWGATWLRFLGYTPNARPPVEGTRRYVHDGFLNLQGPNYALAKTLQMWRATVARNRDGLLVSTNCAPAARTASMVAGDNKNAGTIAVGLGGMGHFPPLASYDQETVAACMAALLVHDLTNAAALANPMAPPMSHPYDLFSAQAFHGGSFCCGPRPGELGTLFYLAGKLLGPASAVKAGAD